jgi:hypothetical protein
MVVVVVVSVVEAHRVRLGTGVGGVFRRRGGGQVMKLGVGAWEV